MQSNAMLKNNQKSEVEVWRFVDGNQGQLELKGFVTGPVVQIQLLESARNLVSSSPVVRVAEFIEINGRLREVGSRYDQRCVTLASKEDLPKGLVKRKPPYR